MTDLPKTCAEAKAVGARRYFTGKPCKRGHVSERNTRGNCVQCNILHKRERRDANPDEFLKKRREYEAANMDRIRARGRDYRAAKIDTITEKKRQYCKNNKEKILEYRAANRDSIKAARKERYLKNPDAYKAARREWYYNNIEATKHTNKKWRQKNSEAYKSRNQEWHRNNPNASRAYSRNRAARKRAAEGSHTAADIARIAAAQKHKCAFCRKSVGNKYHVDHIAPLYLGGSNWPSNLQILCPPCNQRKHAKDPLVFAREIGLLL